VLVSDFNLPRISWNEKLLEVKHDNFHFVEFTSQYGFNQFVFEHTRGNNTLDLVLANDSPVIHDCSTFLPLGNSDHESVTFNLSIPVVEDNGSDDVKFIYDFKNADYELLNAYKSSVDWTEKLSDVQDPNECLDLFISVLKTGLDVHVPIKRVHSSTRSSVYYPLYVRKMQRKKCHAWRFYKRYKTNALKVKYDIIKKEV
jgi:Endonuclease-reverse transcriptase